MAQLAPASLPANVNEGWAGRAGEALGVSRLPSRSILLFAVMTLTCSLLLIPGFQPSLFNCPVSRTGSLQPHPVSRPALATQRCSHLDTTCLLPLGAVFDLLGKKVKEEREDFNFLSSTSEKKKAYFFPRNCVCSSESQWCLKRHGEDRIVQVCKKEFRCPALATLGRFSMQSASHTDGLRGLSAVFKFLIFLFQPLHEATWPPPAGVCCSVSPPGDISLTHLPPRASWDFMNTWSRRWGSSALMSDANLKLSFLLHALLPCSCSGMCSCRSPGAETLLRAAHSLKHELTERERHRLCCAWPRTCQRNARNPCTAYFFAISEALRAVEAGALLRITTAETKHQQKHQLLLCP